MHYQDDMDAARAAVQRADDEGTEAGLAGLGPEANPYTSGRRCYLARYWEESRASARSMS